MALPSPPPQPYADRNYPGMHRGVVSGIGSITVDLGLGHNNFTVTSILVKGGISALAAARIPAWDYHPTIKGAFVITIGKATNGTTTTVIADTTSATVSFAASAGASVG